MRRLLICIAIFLMYSSCTRIEPDYNSFSVDLTIYYNNDDDDLNNISLEGAKVVLTNLDKNYSKTNYASDNDKVSFNNIEPGFYRAMVTHSCSEDGIYYYFNGLKDIDVFSSIIDSVEVIMSKTNAFVIKEYYYSGCLTPGGNQYTADQYVEIYNNSPVVQYADGISIIEHESYAIDANYWTFLGDTIVARMIWTIPGNGTDAPVLPGESIVLARDAINHQDELLGNPLSPVNLLNADFEFWVETASGDDVDGPFSTNLIEDLYTARGNDVAFHNRGGSAIALVKFPGNSSDRKEFIDNHLIKKDPTSSRLFGKIANDFVLDAVEVTWDEAHAIYKRFPIELDAGYTYVPSGSKSGKCVRRKIKEIDDGRCIYQDTNNSCEDFLKDVDPAPWVY